MAGYRGPDGCQRRRTGSRRRPRHPGPGDLARCPAAARPGPVRSRWPRRWPGPSTRSGPSSSRPAPAPASRSPTSCPAAAERAARSWSPPPPRRCRTSWRARTSRSWPSTSDEPFAFAVLKGRSNYVCLQRVAEVGRRRRAARPRRARPSRRLGRASSRRSCAWAADDRDRRPGRARLRAVAAGVGRGQRQPRRSAPGAHALPEGRRVLRRAGPPSAPPRPTSWSSTPTSTASHLASGGAILPEHDVVVIDEAHQLEDIISATSGVELGAGASPRWPASSGRIVADDADAGRRRRREPAIVLAAGARPTTSAGGSRGASTPELGRRARARPRPARRVASRAAGRRRRRTAATSRARKPRAMKPAGVAHRRHRRGRCDVPTSVVAWVEGPDARRRSCRWRRSTSAGVLGRGAVVDARTAVLTSATIPPALPGAARADAGDGYDRARRRQPVRLRGQRPPLLRRPPARPPRAPATRRRMHDELEALIDGRRRAHAGAVHQLAGHGRRRRGAARRGCRGRCSTQGDLPKPALVARSPTTRRRACSPPWASGRASTCPGPTLSLVTIDRLPVPRPDEPLLQARRERARADAFRLVDLPRAATLLAQGAGRLIRTRRPTAASSPCSTPAWPPTPATAGTSCGRCRRCAAPGTADEADGVPAIAARGPETVAGSVGSVLAWPEPTSAIPATPRANGPSTDAASTVTPAVSWRPTCSSTSAPQSVVGHQPGDAAPVRAAWLAAVACPDPVDRHRSPTTATRRAVPPPPRRWRVPVRLELRGLLGADSYLVTRPDGNLLVDSPRFTRFLAEPIDTLGGIAHILLTHRDDVADAEAWADRYGARVWIHPDDADAAPFATDPTRPRCDDRHRPGVSAVPVPGHTPARRCSSSTSAGSSRVTPSAGTAPRGISTRSAPPAGTRGPNRPDRSAGWPGKPPSSGCPGHGGRVHAPPDELHARLVALVDRMGAAA